MVRNQALASVHKKNRGFTLVETMIFIVLISLVFVTLTSLTTLSLKSSGASENKILATHYGEAVQEWLRGEKEIDWDQFVSKADSLGISYCLNSAALSWPGAGLCQANDYSLFGKFKRELLLTLLSGNESVRADVTVFWKDGNNNYQVTTRTVLVRDE